MSRGRDRSRHTWTLKKHSFEYSFSPATQIIPPPCWLSCWLLCCCHVVVVVFVYFVAALPTLPPPPPLACRRRRHHRWPAWRLTPATWTPTAALPRHRKLSDGKNQEQKYNMASGGRQTQIKLQQPTKNMRAWRGRDETWGATSGERGGSTIWLFLGDQVGMLCKKRNYNQCFY